MIHPSHSTALGLDSPPVVSPLTPARQLTLLPDDGTERVSSLRPERTSNARHDGIFGWYHYVQDFHGDFALDWLQRLAEPGDIIWDPFSGAGTTVLASKLAGHASFGYDISPLMIDVATAKTDWSVSLQRLRTDIEDIAVLGERNASTLEPEPAAAVYGTWDDYEDTQCGRVAHYPADKVLRRWISATPLSRFNGLLRAIDCVTDERSRRFLRVAAAATMISAANVRGRPNMSYNSKPTIDYPVLRAFVDGAYAMATDYARVRDLSLPSATVAFGDARTAGPPHADVIFTSPPYPNDMEYVHQTRLELALLGYAPHPHALTDLKKRMISSSVKLVYRQNEWQKHAALRNDQIAHLHSENSQTLAGRKWGWNAADMVAHYFGGMQAVLKNWHDRLSRGGRVGCVIGDSAFNGVLVRSDELLAEFAEQEGFSIVDIDVFRSRWNTKHELNLRESVVVMRKQKR